MSTPAQKRALAKYRASAWYKNRFKRLKRSPKKYTAFIKKRRAYQNRWNLNIKISVLKHYGKRGKLLCAWRGCFISDLDCLTLDHVKNDGAAHRKAGYQGGMTGYAHLVSKNFPAGFQTLCANHQLKKENQRRRKERRVNGTAP